MIGDISEEIIYITSLVSIIDISLTYYILWFDRKINPKKKHFNELNPLGAWIMRITNYGPWGLLIGACISQIIIWGLFIAELQYSIGDALSTQYLFTGAILVAIWMHVYSIKYLNKLYQARIEICKIIGVMLL